MTDFDPAGKAGRKTASRATERRAVVSDDPGVEFTVVGKADASVLESIPLIKEQDDPVAKRIEAMRAQRRERNSQDVSGFKQNLRVPDRFKDPRLTYRFVNDTATRMQEMRDKGWELVSDELLSQDAKDSGLGARSGIGTIVQRIVSDRTVPQPVHGFLMAKPKEFYEEDKRREQDAIKRNEQSIQQPASQKDEQGSPVDGMYVPAGGMSIKHGT